MAQRHPSKEKLSPASEDDDSKQKRGFSGVKAHLQFFVERIPIIPYLLLAGGPVLSTMCHQNVFDTTKFLYGGFGNLLSLITLRYMDDVKDYEKDKICHKDRPLPRGLVKYNEIVHAIHFLIALQFAFAVVIAKTFTFEAGIYFGFFAFYLFLMYIEFGLGEWIEDRPFLYAVSHQISIYFGGMALAELFTPGTAFAAKTLLASSTGLSGFFTYEVCRKLDPTLPRIKGTYLVIYGKAKTFLITVGSVSLGIFASSRLGYEWLLFPIQVALLVSLALLFLLVPISNRWAHKVVELIALIYLLLHLWCTAINYYYS
eukprot:Colp12_sorted_trinity150504_noHs@7546